MYYNNGYQPQMMQLQQYQQQLQQMQNPQQFQNTQISTPKNTIIPVANFQEVQAYATDWTGNATYFIDNNAAKIYVKQLNAAGSVDITTYEKAKENVPVQYATVEEVNNIKNILDNLLAKLGGAKQNDE